MPSRAKQLLLTLIHFPFAPRKVARWHEQSSLRTVYALHLVGLGVLAVIVALISELWTLLPGSTASLWQVLTEDPAALPVALGVVAGGELVFVLVATVMMCWAGCDEPVIETWKHSLRVSWLYVAHLWWVTAGIGVTVVIAEQGGPVLPTTAFIGLLVRSTLIGWSMVSYGRALTLSRTMAADGTSNCCEQCGYSLAYLDGTDRCPECGYSIRDSLETTRTPLDQIHAKRLWWLSWLRPEGLFGRLAVRQHSSRAIRIFVILHLLSGIGAGVGFVGAICVRVGVPSGDWEFIPVIMLVFGLFVGWISFMVASCIASAVGAWVSKNVGRNRMVASFQVVALTSALFVPWTAISAVAIEAVMNTPRTDTMIVWLAASIAVAIWYSLRVAARMRYVQYSNQ